MKKFIVITRGKGFETTTERVQANTKAEARREKNLKLPNSFRGSVTVLTEAEYQTSYSK